MPEENMSDSQKWNLAKPSNSFKKWFRNHSNHVKFIKEFETDVTKNPYRHPTKKKIAPVQDEHNYPKGCYRWRKTDLRIVYLPNKPDHTIYPLDADSAGGIGYK